MTKPEIKVECIDKEDNYPIRPDMPNMRRPVIGDTYTMYVDCEEGYIFIELIGIYNKNHFKIIYPKVIRKTNKQLVTDYITKLNMW